MVATYDDANLLLKLISWGEQSGLNAAQRSLFAEDFDPETASMDDENVGRVLGFYEVVGTLVKQKIMDAGLVYDMWTITMLWNKVSSVARRGRAESGEPRLWENFELLSANQPT